MAWVLEIKKWLSDTTLAEGTFSQSAAHIDGPCYSNTIKIHQTLMFEVLSSFIRGFIVVLVLKHFAIRRQTFFLPFYWRYKLQMSLDELTKADPPIFTEGEDLIVTDPTLPRSWPCSSSSPTERCKPTGSRDVAKKKCRCLVRLGWGSWSWKLKPMTPRW